MGDEGGPSALAEHGQPEIGRSPCKNEGHSDAGHQHGEAPTVCQRSAVRQHPVAVVCAHGTVSVARRGAPGQARAGKAEAPGLSPMSASLSLLHLHSSDRPAIVHMPGQQRGRGQHGRGGAGAGRRWPAGSLRVARCVTHSLWRGRGVSPGRGRAPRRHKREPCEPARAPGPPRRSAPHGATVPPRERVWRARTAPGTISSVSVYPSSRCKEGLSMSQTATLRTLIQSPDLLVMPGIFDGFSARLVAHSGFAAGFISGAGLSETLLGWSDVGLMGFALNLAAVTRLAACCTLPLLADADTGYGNAVNVYYTTHAFEQAGVAGLMIEDQTWPKRCGHMQGKEVITAEEMGEKVHAACDARRDPAFVLMARTDAFAAHGLQDVLRRLTLYAEAGADLLFADALVSEHDIATVARHVPKPLCVNMGFGIRSRATTPLIAPAQLQALGVAVVIYPRLLTACAVQGM